MKNNYWAFLFLLALFPVFVLAKEKINTGWLSSVAVQGYDVVAYHTQNKPVKGSKQFASKYNGATWYFSSQKNLNAFEENPNKFAPQYGGYCAYAVAQGKTAGIDPKVFAIHNGKLYLNYNKEVGEKWKSNKEEFIKKANANWKKIGQ